MTGSAMLQNYSIIEPHVSEESAQFGKPIWGLLQVGWEKGISTSLTESLPWGRYETERFHELARSWREDTRYLSSVHEIVLHPAYQQIIGMGPAAVPLIINELQNSPDHWFWALRAITGEDPVALSHRGNIRKMAQDWVQWYGKRGLMR